MKKMRLLLLAIALFSSTLSFGQLQRLVSLPASMGYAGNPLPGLCLDLLQGSPLGDTYLTTDGSTMIANSYSRLSPADGVSYGDAKFWNPAGAAERIPAYYQDFVLRKIAEYRQKGPMNAKLLDQLQDEIWAYNGMDLVGGYINVNSTDQIAEFKAGKKKFQNRFGLEDNNPAAISDQASELIQLKESAAFTAPQSVRFTKQGIACRTGNATHTIGVNYDGVSFEDVTGMTQQVNNGITVYGNTYRHLPDRTSISTYEGKNDTYLLAFSSDSWPRHKMNFTIPNDLFVIKITINKGLQDYCLIK